jgi:3-dehydroquinate dehydratase-1
MAWDKPVICASIVENDIAAIKSVEPFVDFFEVRIDHIGSGWRNTIKNLQKPWLACNRRVEEGGSWWGSESGRIGELFKAVELGAEIVDIELATPGVEKIVEDINRRADCLLSYHDLKDTPPLEEMQDIIRHQLAAGADICKVVTTARHPADNIAVLQLIRDFPENKVISFAMGEAGQISRVLCPLVGGYFSYASIKEGRESAAGQMTVKDLMETYKILKIYE